MAAVRPEHLATLIYTSGTTGRPKGVELPHRCWTYIGAAAEASASSRRDDLQYLWLPLSHSFGKMLEAVQLQIGFPTAVDGRLDRIVDNLAVVRPTFMAGPPRIFEKVHGKVVQTVEEEGGIKAPLFTWAFDVGGQVVAGARIEGQPPGPLLRAQHALADRLVLAKIRDRLGGRIRFLALGQRGALARTSPPGSTPPGMLMLEGYGLTETSARRLHRAARRPAVRRRRAAARRAPSQDRRRRRDPHPRPGVMRGYHNRPEATAEVLGADGWFATGDVGELDAEGRLRVTDRKKDLIKTSGGKYIAPQAIEGMFKAICPLASQMVVHGDGRNYATALITLDPEALAAVGPGPGPDDDRLRRAGRRPGGARLRARLRRRAERAGSTAGRRSRTSGSSTTT